MAAELADVHPGVTAAVFGCGPVGQFVIASLKLLGAGRIFAIDTIPSRLAMAKKQGAETIDFNAEDPVQTLRELTGGIGVDRAVDAVGVDAVAPHSGPAVKQYEQIKKPMQQELEQVARKTHPSGGNWEPGDAPSMVFPWAVNGLAKAGTLSIIGVYPQTVQLFPIGAAMNKNLTLQMGNCNHRKYIPKLVDLVRTGEVDPTEILTHSGPLSGAIEAYKNFDKRAEGWIKVMVEPQAPPALAA
jgi:threonine dehydrogenase-like Zn-dependent dehydrogenase